jgi:hypothetical protein
MRKAFMKNFAAWSVGFLSINFALGVMAQFDCSNNGVVEAGVVPWTADGPVEGDGDVQYLDWVQIANFAAGLDTPFDPCQFAAADCAPRSSLGDDIISTIDVVQAIRYAVGLDPLDAVGGPTNVIFTPRVPGVGPRTVFIDSGNYVRGQDGTATVYLDAAGDEVGVGFSLIFDRNQLEYKSFTNTLDAFIVANTNLASNGYLGFITLSIGDSYSAGNNPLVSIVFTAVGVTNTTTAISLGDTPVFGEIASTNADPLESTFSGISVIVTGPSFFSQPSWSSQGFRALFNSDAGSVYTIESSTNLASWKLLTALTNTTGTTPFVDGSAVSSSNQFYRAVLVP